MGQFHPWAVVCSPDTRPLCCAGPNVKEGPLPPRCRPLTFISFQSLLRVPDPSFCFPLDVAKVSHRILKLRSSRNPSCSMDHLVTQTRNLEFILYDFFLITLSLHLISHQSSVRSIIYFLVLDMWSQVQLSHSVWIVSPQSLTKGLSGRLGASPPPNQPSPPAVSYRGRDVATQWLYRR